MVWEWVPCAFCGRAVMPLRQESHDASKEDLKLLAWKIWTVLGKYGNLENMETWKMWQLSMYRVDSGPII